MLFGIPFIEWIGYLSSVFIVISLLMSDVVKLRILNSIGCLLFVIYGVITGAWPVAVSNGLIVIINLYYLIKMYQVKHT